MPLFAIPFPAIDPIVFTIGDFFAIRWYALAYIVGLIGGWWYMRTMARLSPHSMSPADTDDLLTWATLGVVLGGRLGYVLFYNPYYYLDNPGEILQIWKGGMSFHGGLLGVAFVLVVFARMKRLRLLAVSDIVACAAPIGLFFGRIANFINGELYGRPAPDVPWAVTGFPGAGDLPRHPSQIYEALLEGLVLFFLLRILWRIKAVRTRTGMLTGLFLVGYALARGFVEQFREPDSHIGFLFGEFTMGQLLSAPMLIAGVLLILLARRTIPAAVGDTRHEPAPRPGTNKQTKPAKSSSKKHGKGKSNAGKRGKDNDRGGGEPAEPHFDPPSAAAEPDPAELPDRLPAHILPVPETDEPRKKGLFGRRKTRQTAAEADGPAATIRDNDREEPAPAGTGKKARGKKDKTENTRNRTRHEAAAPTPGRDDPKPRRILGLFGRKTPKPRHHEIPIAFYQQPQVASPPQPGAAPAAATAVAMPATVGQTAAPFIEPTIEPPTEPLADTAPAPLPQDVPPPGLASPGTENFGAAPVPQAPVPQAPVPQPAADSPLTPPQPSFEASSPETSPAPLPPQQPALAPRAPDVPPLPPIPEVPPANAGAMPPPGPGTLPPMAPAPAQPPAEYGPDSDGADPKSPAGPPGQEPPSQNG